MILLLAPLAETAPLDPPAPEVLNEAREIVQNMIGNTRGPYRRIRWFCADGTVLPPNSYACREHGGGRQHAEYSDARQRLAALGWSVGTIFAALDVEELLESEPRALRLRQLPLEKYLSDIDDGWVLQKAKDYRGRVQIEDETATGRKLLLQLLANEKWATDNYLLMREIVRTIPHGEDTDLGRRVRRAAIELAEREPRAEQWRAEIHASPGVTTAPRLRKWAATLADAETRSMAMILADDLDELYGAKGRKSRLKTHLAKLSGKAIGPWRDVISNALTRPFPESVGDICGAVQEARTTLLVETSPSGRLQVIDALDGVETEVRLAAEDYLGGHGMTRRQYLEVTDDLLGCVFGGGFLSTGELASLRRYLRFDTGNTMPVPGYHEAVAQLRRVPGWAAGNIRFAFAEALVRYGALDPRAARFSDDLLRGSTAWVLGDILRILATDVGRLNGTRTLLAGVETSAASALNPGIATGTLRILDTLEAANNAELSPTDVVVLPETLAELSPIAGILTLGEGNALSHVQLLARNFGIPNVAIDPSALDLLRPLNGTDVVLIAASDGSVALFRRADVPVLEPFFAATGEAADEQARITVPPPDLSVRKPLPLDTISRSLSGKVVGPKAANLGELNRLFPGRVAPAIALPFGIFAEHVDAIGMRDRLKTLYDEYRSGRIRDAAFDSAMEKLRNDIAGLFLHDDTRARLTREMQNEFGEPGTYGLFVRSDTNVEDLPEFTGAGLSETLPNVVGMGAQLQAIPRVWSSVLSPRAIAWRSNLLTNPEQVFASVLLMKSVPSDKSGVLVTSNLNEPGQDGLTVSTAWGIGGAVAGEAAETLVILDDDTRLISEAKAPYRRRLSPAGGIAWEPVSSGAVLTAAEITALRGLARQVNEKYRPVFDIRGKARPWDIEFGFVGGELTLFQIRPLVERGTLRADRAIGLVFDEPAVPHAADATVNLNESPLARVDAQ